MPPTHTHTQELHANSSTTQAHAVARMKKDRHPISVSMHFPSITSMGLGHCAFGRTTFFSVQHLSLGEHDRLHVSHVMMRRCTLYACSEEVVFLPLHLPERRCLCALQKVLRSFLGRCLAVGFKAKQSPQKGSQKGW